MRINIILNLQDLKPARNVMNDGGKTASSDVISDLICITKELP